MKTNFAIFVAGAPLSGKSTIIDGFVDALTSSDFNIPREDILIVKSIDDAKKLPTDCNEKIILIDGLEGRDYYEEIDSLIPFADKYLFLIMTPSTEIVARLGDILVCSKCGSIFDKKPDEILADTFIKRCRQTIKPQPKQSDKCYICYEPALKRVDKSKALEAVKAYDQETRQYLNGLMRVFWEYFYIVKEPVSVYNRVFLVDECLRKLNLGTD